MPAALTQSEYKKLLKAAYGDTVFVIGKVAGAGKKILHGCAKCGNEWEVAPTALVSRKRKGVPVLKCGCPLCGKEQNRISNTGKAGTTTLSEEEWRIRLADKPTNVPQPKIELLSEYKTGNTVCDFKCTSCSVEFSTTPLLLVQRVYNCECANPNLQKNIQLSKSERAFIKRLYTKASMNIFQICTLTGYSESFIRRLGSADGWIRKERNVFKRDRKHRQLRLQQRDSLEKKLYTHNARRLTQIIYNRYVDILDPDRLKGKGFELDHMMSISDAYCKSSKGPISLRVVCHPANLQMLTLKANRNKASTSEGVSTLKQRMVEFESTYGPVDFPSEFKYDYRLTPKLDTEDGLTVLGFDPGTVNFGVAVSKIFGCDSIERINVLETAMLGNPLTDIVADMQSQYASFSAEIRSYIDTYDPDVIVIERFASRGLKGKTIELVGFMIGAIIAIASSYNEKGKHIIIRPVMPASWKNQVNRASDLDYLYKGFKTKKVVAHKVDAALMSLYAFPSKENPYLFLTKPSKRKQWIKSMLDAAKL